VETLRQVSLDLTRFDSVQQLFQNTLLLASTLAVLLAGGWAMAQGRSLERPDYGRFYVVAALFATQSRTIVETVPAIRMGMRAFARVARCSAGSGTRNLTKERSRSKPFHQLHLENLSFAYAAGRGRFRRRLTGYPARRKSRADTLPLLRGER